MVGLCLLKLESILYAAICFAGFVALVVCHTRMRARVPFHNPVPSQYDPDKQTLDVKQIALDCNKTEKWTAWALLPLLAIPLTEDKDMSLVIGWISAAAIIQLINYIYYRSQLKKYTAGKWFRMTEATLVKQYIDVCCDDGPDDYILCFESSVTQYKGSKTVTSQFYDSVAVGDTFYLAIHRNKKGKEVIGGCYPTASYIPDPQVADILRRCAKTES